MAFVHHFPFDFKLLNNKGEDEFYLEDKSEPITLVITNQRKDSEKITFNKDKVQVSANSYHFALRFRPGTINPGGSDQVIGDWTVKVPETSNEDGSMLLRIQYNGGGVALGYGDNLVIQFSLNINGAHGTRSTNVVLIDNVSTAGKTTKRQINWTIINHRGKPQLPLEITFKDDDTILNDGTPNSLSFRISNTNKNSTATNPHLHFNGDPGEGPVSKIYIYFDTGDDAAHILAGAETVKDIEITVGQSSLFTFEDHSRDPLPSWMFKSSQNVCLLSHVNADENEPNRLIHPQADNRTEITTIDFTVANIITHYISGKTRMYVRFENIPGYWDNTFVLQIDKQPLVMKGQKVGIGTNDSYFTLDVQGDGIGYNTGNKWDHLYLSHDGDVASMVAGGAEKGLALKVGKGSTGTYNDSSQNYTEAIRLLPGGNVGIGTSTPIAPLSFSDNGGQKITLWGQAGNTHGIGIQGSLLQIHTDIKEADIAFGYGNSNAFTETIRIKGNGNVGIGTNAPADKLHIQVNNNGLNLPLFVRNENGSENTGNAVGIGFLNEQMGNWAKAAIVHERTGGYGIGSIKFLVNNEENNTTVSLADTRMTLAPNGNVGIQRKSPQFTLDVDGNARFGNINIVNNEVLQFGHGMPGREENAGKIGYGTFDSDSLCIVGAGATDTNRRITLWAEGGANIIGKLGIGTSSPGFPLDVNGWNNGHMEEGFFFMFHNIDEVRRSRGTYDNAVSIKASNLMWSQGFATYSDIRIKDNVNISKGDLDLHLINRLEVTDYNYKDFIVKGEKKYKGLLAQNVEKVFPQAVSKTADYIPDIYAVPANVEVNNGSLFIKMNAVHGLEDGDKVRLMTATNIYIEKEVKLVDAKTFIVQDWIEPVEQVFVYGRQVHDFRVLDYDQIFTAGISAIKELSKQADALKALVQAQEGRINQLEERLQIIAINAN